MKSIDSAADLFREIKRRGLELRRGEGRDDALYCQLAERLGLDPSAIQRDLDEGHVSIEEFVYAFFSILQPFAQMYSDVYVEMQHHRVEQAKQEIRLQFDFSKSSGELLEFDLEHFRREMEHVRRIKMRAPAQLWTHNDLLKLFSVHKLLLAGFSPSEFKCRPYGPGDTYRLPSPSGVSEPLRRMLRIIHHVYQQIIDEAAATHGIQLPEDQIRLGEDNSPTKSVMLTDLVPGYLAMVERFSRSPASEETVAERVSEAIDYFENEIEANLHQGREDQTVLIRELLDILALPLWRRRWYLYEVWASMLVVSALHDYSIRLALTDGTLSFEEGRAACVAEFDTAGSLRISLWAQKQTPLKGVPGRRAIMPDLRLCLSDPGAPESTIVLVEFKQRKSMTRSDVIKLVNLYDVGTPGSIGNSYLNYDEFPADVEAKFADPDKTYLFGHLNPQYAENVTRFKTRLIQLLRVAGYEPAGDEFDILLLDVSASMAAAYSDPDVLPYLKGIVDANPQIRVFLFNTCLIDPPGVSDLLSSGLSRFIGGITDLERALQELTVRHPGAKRLLLVTDGEYEPAPGMRRFESVVCLPAELKTVVSNRDG